MVLDVRLCAVITAGGAKISEGEVSVGSAGKFEYCSGGCFIKEKLGKKGSIFIFFQKQKCSWEYDYGK